MIDIPDAWYRISAKALILNEQGQFLLCRESDGNWDLPGGGLDQGESPRDCIIRELREKLGGEAIWVDNKPSYFITIDKLASKKKPWIANVCYRTILKDFHFTPSNECVEMRFFDTKSVANVPVRENIAALVEQMKKE